MDPTTAIVFGLGIIAVVAIYFVSRFRGKSEIKIKSKLGQFDAKGENPPPPTAIPTGVKIEDAEAGRNFNAHSRGPGGVELKKVKAKGDIDVSASRSDSPPKM